ncbi:hypothetical protein HZH66_008387 [Vespula vulgaris]|uniref:Uncharacterized protein n=1 Tax=Vespula vulgaris TaxID=7454 RepID=A0A834N2F7_VESVU|nr:hypothetical protein HZH66_008387 [Vespula vulgaris]
MPQLEGCRDPEKSGESIARTIRIEDSRYPHPAVTCPPENESWETRKRKPAILKFQDKILKGYTHSNGTHGASEIPQEVLETRKRKKRVTGYTATCTAEPDIALTIVQSRGRHHPWLP